MATSCQRMVASNRFGISCGRIHRPCRNKPRVRVVGTAHGVDLVLCARIYRGDWRFTVTELNS